MKILIADDDNVSRLLLHRLLNRWGFDSVEVADGEKALEIMRADDAPELVLLDWEMPKADGPEVCRQLRLMDKAVPPYIIFVTAKDTLFDLVLGLDMGASDFIRKPYKQEELRARIQVGIRTIALQTQLVEARNRMEHLAMYDMLTEVYNRRAIMDLFGRELSRCAREQHTLLVAMADLDYFKKLNDQSDTLREMRPSVFLVRFCATIPEKVIWLADGAAKSLFWLPR